MPEDPFSKTRERNDASLPVEPPHHHSFEKTQGGIVDEYYICGCGEGHFPEIDLPME